MGLGIGLLWGPTGRRFLMSEVPLYTLNPEPQVLNPKPAPAVLGVRLARIYIKREKYTFLFIYIYIYIYVYHMYIYLYM